MDRKAAKELLHIEGWLARAGEAVARGKDAYLADDLLQEAGDSLMMKLGEAANRMSRLDVLAPDGVEWALAVANRNFIIHQYDQINRELTMWVPGEVVLYAGKAGTSLRSRVSQYYRTRLGARSPHAGGWPLKTLASLGYLQVHTISVTTPRQRKRPCWPVFMAAVPSDVSARLCDPSMPLPFANLEDRPGRAKAHGFRGARAPR